MRRLIVFLVLLSFLVTSCLGDSGTGPGQKPGEVMQESAPDTTGKLQAKGEIDDQGNPTEKARDQAGKGPGAASESTGDPEADAGLEALVDFVLQVAKLQEVQRKASQAVEALKKRDMEEYLRKIEEAIGVGSEAYLIQEAVRQIILGLEPVVELLRKGALLDFYTKEQCETIYGELWGAYTLRTAKGDEQRIRELRRSVAEVCARQR